MHKTRGLNCVLVVLLLVCGCSHSQRPVAVAATQPVITSDLLNRVPVIGRLGLPLGTPVEIRASVVAGAGLSKALEVKYLLRVTEVGAKPLREPEIMEFVIAPGASVSLAPDEFSLYEMKTGNKARGLNSEQIKKLEEGYVGKAVHLTVFETGWFHGAPNGTGAMWQDVGFGFSTYLWVLSEE